MTKEMTKVGIFSIVSVCTSAGAMYFGGHGVLPFGIFLLMGLTDSRGLPILLSSICSVLLVLFGLYFAARFALSVVGIVGRVLIAAGLLWLGGILVWFICGSEAGIASLLTALPALLTAVLAIIQCIRMTKPDVAGGGFPVLVNEKDAGRSQRGFKQG